MKLYEFKNTLNGILKSHKDDKELQDLIANFIKDE